MEKPKLTLGWGLYLYRVSAMKRTHILNGHGDHSFGLFLTEITGVHKPLLLGLRCLRLIQDQCLTLLLPKYGHPEGHQGGTVDHPVQGVCHQMKAAIQTGS